MNPDRKFPLNMMQLTLMLSQDTGHLNTLMVATRINNLGYNPNLQASLDDLIIGIHLDMHKVLKVLEADVEVMEAKNLRLRQILDIEDFMDTASDLDTTWRLAQPELEGEGNSITVEDPRSLNTSIAVYEEEEEEEETLLEAKWRLELANLEAGAKRILHNS